MSEICFIEAKPRVVATGAQTTIRLAGGGSDTAYYRGGQHFRAGVVEMPRFRASFGFDDNGWTGGTVPTSGRLGFMPGDTSLIATLAALYWREAAITIDGGEETAALSRRLTGTVADIATNDGQIALTLVDPSKLLDKPVLSTGFAGSGGIEGPSEATGRAKRRSWGRVFNVEGALLDKVNNIYEFGDPSHPLQAFDAVRDKGRAGGVNMVAWQGSVAATFVALQAAIAPQGGCAAAPSIACVKWWTVPAGPMTADIRGETAGGYVETAVAIAARMLAAVAGPAITNQAAADALRPAMCGVHIASGTDTIAQALDRLFLGLSLYWVLEPAGTIRVGEWAWKPPSASFQAQFIGRERQLSPVKSRKVGYRRNHRPHQPGEISAAVLLADDVAYLDGTPIEHLKPAEPGATDGATAGDNLKDSGGGVLGDADVVTSQGTAADTSNIGGIPTATFKAAVTQAEADIADLFATYGDTSSASASALAAAEAKAGAIAAANAADGFAEVATNKADAAEGSREAAHGEAVTAGDAATVATAKAAAATADAASALDSKNLTAFYRAQAETQAGIAISQAAIATDKAAAAQTSATIAASVSGGNILRNGAFADWPGAANSTPPSWGYQIANGSGSIERRSATTHPTTSPYYVEFYSLANSGPYYRSQTVRVQTDAYLVLEVDGELGSNTWIGDGVAVYFYNSSGTYLSYQVIDFHFDKTSNGYAPGSDPVAGQYGKKSWAKLMKAPANAYAATIYLGSLDTIFGVTAANRYAKWYNLYRIALRQATSAEIAAGTTLPALEATVATQSSVLATHGTRLASWLASTSAGPALAEISMVALDSNGVAASNIGLKASRIIISNPLDNNETVEVAKFENGQAKLNNALIRNLRVIPNGLASLGFPVQLAPLTFLAKDGDVVTYSASIGLPASRIEADTSGIVVPSGSSLDVRAVASAAAGFTARAKLLGSPVYTNQTASSGVNVGGTPQWQMHKPTVADAYNGLYQFYGALTLTRTSFYIEGPGQWYGTYFGIVEVYANSGSGWVHIGTIDEGGEFPFSSAPPATMPGGFSSTIQYTGAIGQHGGYEFGVSGPVTGFNGAKYTTMTSSTETPITQNIPFKVYPALG